MLLLTDDPGLWRRGCALALLLLSALLVRNEALHVVGLLAAAFLASEIRMRRRGQGVPARRLAIATGVPLLLVLLVAGGLYTRGVQRGDELRGAFVSKEKLNVCQADAVNYQQRHPDRFVASASLSAAPLCSRCSARLVPRSAPHGLRNPRAMAAYTAWHARLLPNGLQLGLFDAVSGEDNPDYVPTKLERTYPGLLSARRAAAVRCSRALV